MTTKVESKKTCAKHKVTLPRRDGAFSGLFVSSLVSNVFFEKKFFSPEFHHSKCYSLGEKRKNRRRRCNPLCLLSKKSSKRRANVEPRMSKPNHHTKNTRSSQVTVHHVASRSMPFPAPSLPPLSLRSCATRSGE